MTHREIKRGQSNRCLSTRFGKRASRLGQGLEQIEPRIMLAGDAPVVFHVIPAAEQTRYSFTDGLIDLSSSFSSNESADSTGKFDYHLSGLTTGSLLVVTQGMQDFSVVDRTNNQLVWLQQPVITPATEGGFAVIQLRFTEPIATEGISPGTRDAIATGVAAPLAPTGRSTLGSDAPLEAARGRSQAFELSMSVQESVRSAQVVNTQAVDAALALSGQLQPTATATKPSAATEPDAQASVDELLAAARMVEAKLLATKPVAPESAAARQATSESAALSRARDLDVSDELPTDSLLAAEASPATDADLARKSLLTPLLAFDKTNLTDVPGVWLFTVVVSLAGLYWQKSGVASHRWPARENESPEPRLRRVAFAGRRAG